MNKYETSKHKAQSRRGGNNRHAKSYADMIVTVETAGQILRKPLSIVRQQARDGQLPVQEWVDGSPYFRAGDLMDLNPS